MGIDTDIRNKILRRKFPAAFTKRAPYRSNIVEIHDILTRLFRLKSSSYSSMFTGRELYHTLFAPVVNKLATRSIMAYIVCVDIQSAVPKQKTRTQTKRDLRAAMIRQQRHEIARENRTPSIKSVNELDVKKFTVTEKKKPTYPLDSKITDGGIIVNNRPVARFNITQLVRTRGLRIVLWRYLFEQLKKEKWPSDGHLIFDFEDGGAYLFRDGIKPRQLTQFMHVCSEGEAMCAYWATVYRNYSVELHSIDTDTIPLMLHTMNRRKFKSVLWVMGSYNNDVCDLSIVHKKLPSALGISIDTFIWYCIMCKTDYVFREDALPGIGFMRMFEVIAEWGPKKRSPADHYISPKGADYFLILFMAMVLARKSKKNLPKEQWRKRGIHGMVYACGDRLPKAKVISQYMNEIVWNYKYWFPKNVPYKFPTGSYISWIK